MSIILGARQLYLASHLPQFLIVLMVLELSETLFFFCATFHLVKVSCICRE